MAEQMMQFFAWDARSSQGEALSRILAELFYPASAYDGASSVSVAPWVNPWLNASPRQTELAQMSQKTIPITLTTVAEFSLSTICVRNLDSL